MTTMKQADPGQVRRLAYIKCLFRIGVSNLDRGMDPYAAQALLAFDNCLEMMLWLVVDSFRIKMSRRKDETHFPKLLLEVREWLITNQPVGPCQLLLRRSSELEELHRARNGVQHHGIIPSIVGIQRYRGVTESVLVEISKEAFGLSWSNISMALLIEEPVVRDLYTRAEEAFHSQRYLEAALGLIATFECAKAMEVDRRAGSGILSHRISALDAAEKSDNHAVECVVSYAQAIEKEVEILKLGIDYKGYQLYREVARVDPFFALEGAAAENAEAVLEAVKSELSSSETLRDDEGLQEWSTFALGFVMDSVLHWQLIRRRGLVERLAIGLGQHFSSERAEI